VERFSAANAYAAANGRQGMSVLNNNLSLARMVDPVWPGCLHMSDPASRGWLAANRVAHLSWSSQARGFFTGRADRELRQPGLDPELRRCWISDDNLRRRERCIAMAKEKGVLPINIAAAYVLCQPFESYALIGPETVHELETCLPALDIRLTPAELDQLWG
jgi:aryl-alcohol dehydrogenase-like predicted oxidoreductase